jgi:hypothetical protein
MDLRKGARFSVARGEKSPEQELFILPRQEGDPEESGIRLAKAGDYFYLSLKNFFDREEVPYDEYRIRYDIEREATDDRVVYVLRQRIKNER